MPNGTEYASLNVSKEAAAKIRNFAHLLSIRANGNRVTLSDSILKAYELAEKYLETV
jgi:hypothetical protein